MDVDININAMSKSIQNVLEEPFHYWRERRDVLKTTDPRTNEVYLIKMITTSSEEAN